MQTEIGQIEDPVKRFFAFMVERHNIYILKNSGQPRPWTEDPILNQYKFTNIYRELDKTTKWFRENVRDPLREKPEVFLATVLFRWFNRIEIGEIIFKSKLNHKYTIWDLFLQKGNGKDLEKVIRLVNPKGPWVTGAYLITSKKGMDKLAGMCSIIEDFYHGKYPKWGDEDYNWQDVALECLGLQGEIGLEDVWFWLKQVPFQGPFHAYEVVTDLRHTSLLDQAPDINTWANAGPGAIRGLNRINDKPLDNRIKQDQACIEMTHLLETSRDSKYWPNNDLYPPLELREIEMSLCEWDKYERVRLGQGKPRSIYK